MKLVRSAAALAALTLALVLECCQAFGAAAVESDHWASGGAGAEFLVVVCGDIMTMPGLPRTPAANSINVDDSGNIAGLF